MSAAKKTAVDSAVGVLKSPINFKEFSKDPVKGLLFIVLIAIGYLYVDIKLSNQDIQEKQNKKIEVLEVKVDDLTRQLRKSDSALSSAVSKIRVLQELGKIK
jgi:archaellum component FlaF (FlaF/FlaG flagellin family)